MTLIRNVILAIGLFIQLYGYAQPLTETYIPPQAYTYKDIIRVELDTNFKHIPTYNYVPSLIEHESCISLKHSRCWSSTSKLKTSREEGAGLGQITRTYNKDGSLRFDTLSDLKRQYKSQLKELSWSNVYSRPDLQIRAIVLMVRDSYAKLSDVDDPYERLSFADAAYNGGLKGVNNDRRACSLSESCDANIWFDNVETTCTKSKNALYGQRSPCDINRHHVRDVMTVNLPKYKRYYFKE